MKVIWTSQNYSDIWR